MARADQQLDVVLVTISLVGLVASLVSVFKFGIKNETFNLVFAVISMLSFCTIIGLELSKRLPRK